MYKQEHYNTPYERLKSLDHAEQYLKEGITIDKSKTSDLKKRKQHRVKKDNKRINTRK
mgnify:CR=1 FL=1